MSGSTPATAATPRSPIPMTGTWYGRMGTRPYELLAPPTVLRVAQEPTITLPAHILAA